MSGRHKRRWLQFSLASLLLVMTVLGLGLGRWTSSARQQEQAVKVLREKGLEIQYGHDPWIPAWACKGLKIDYVGYVLAVRIEGDTITDDDLATLRSFPRLRTVVIEDAPNVTDAGLVHLATMKNLHHISLRCPQFTDAGLVHLKGLHGLRELVVLSNHITDAGLVHLKELPLQMLYLASDNITDDELVHLEPHTKIEVLMLDCPITDAGMKHLIAFVHMQSLLCCGPSRALGRRVACENAKPARFNCTEWTLDDICSYLDGAHYIAARLDEEALAVAHIDPTAQFSSAPAKPPVDLRSFLDAILHPHGLGWYVGDEEVVITTIDVDNEKHAGINRLRAALPKLKEVEYSW